MSVSFTIRASIVWLTVCIVAGMSNVSGMRFVKGETVIVSDVDVKAFDALDDYKTAVVEGVYRRRVVLQLYDGLVIVEPMNTDTFTQLH